MNTIQLLINYLINIDIHLVNFVATYGVWTYIILFSIIFAETGLVVCPFLPGDSLLFAAGSIAAYPSEPINIYLLFVFLTTASILGNKVNYLVGRYFGHRLFKNENSKLFNQKYLHQAHAFYEKHGGKAIIFGRFFPIIRTFVPFVAGMGTMNLKEFSFYNVASAIIWIGSMLACGYFFGSLPFIRDNFSIVIYTILIFSVLPMIITFLYHRRYKST